MTTTPMTYEEAFTAIRPLVGERVRQTYPNGQQRVGLVGYDERYGALTFDGSLVGGELAGSVQIEAMLPNGRYGEPRYNCPFCGDKVRRDVRHNCN